MRFNPDFCEESCPICTRARRGSRPARILQALEMILTFGGCPWGRARRRKYGVGPDEALPVAGKDHIAKLSVIGSVSVVAGREGPRPRKEKL